MARKSIEDVMNEIEDFLNSCKTTALSSNKVVVPRDEFDELFGDLKVKIPAEIDRCKKIMRNKDAILMEARRTADGIIAEATAKANQMVAQTEIMALANQQAYETVELARVQANDMLAQAVAESNELRFGAMQYTNDIMMGIRSYIEATLNAERANYENLIATLNNDFMLADANLEEIQSQIVEFTGDPNSVTKAPQMRTPASYRRANAGAGAGAEAKTEQPKVRASVAQRVKQAVAAKEKAALEEAKPSVDIPDFITSGESVVPNETPLEPNVSVKKTQPKEAASAQPIVDDVQTARTDDGNFTKTSPVAAAKTSVAAKTSTGDAINNTQASTQAVGSGELSATEATEPDAKAAASAPAEGTSSAEPRKVKKKIVKKRNPVIHTPQTAQETVAKTLEAAAAAKAKMDKDKTVYKANGEQAREVPPQEGRVKRGPRVGRGVVEGTAEADDNVGGTEQHEEKVSSTPTKSLGVVDDFTMDPKI